MSAREDKVTTLKLLGEGYLFKAEASKMTFDGYDKVYKEFGSKVKDTILPDFSSVKNMTLEKSEKNSTFYQGSKSF